jgi:hypothetical protein
MKFRSSHFTSPAGVVVGFFPLQKGEKGVWANQAAKTWAYAVLVLVCLSPQRTTASLGK